jgi:hypothetical protein
MHSGRIENTAYSFAVRSRRVARETWHWSVGSRHQVRISMWVTAIVTIISRDSSQTFRRMCLDRPRPRPTRYLLSIHGHLPLLLKLCRKVNHYYIVFGFMNSRIRILAQKTVSVTEVSSLCSSLPARKHQCLKTGHDLLIQYPHVTN